MSNKPVRPCVSVKAEVLHENKQIIRDARTDKQKRRDLIKAQNEATAR